MNLKRGILIALALYAVTLIVGIIITLVTRVSISSPQDIPTTFWIITIVTTVFLTSLASIWYFNKVKRSTKEGLKLGITFVLTGLVIDIVLFLTQPGGIQLIKEYYSNVSFYIVLVLVVASCVFIGSQNNSNSSNIEKSKIKNKYKKK